MAQHYAPEEVSGAILATELAEDLVKRGHQVTFIACAPNYPNGIVFPSYKNALCKSEMLNEVRIIRTWSYITPRKGFFQRALNIGIFSISAFFGGLIAGKADIIMSYSPPLPLGISAWLLSCFYRIPWVLRVEDLYPEAAIAAGVLRNRLVIRIFNWLERFIYNKADHISLISEGFQRNLLKKGELSQKLSVASVWADPDLIFPMPKDNEFREKLNLTGKFVVMYAGALGHSSVLEDILEAANLLRQNEEIIFLIIGEGVKKESLMLMAKSHQLENALFLPFQPREHFAEMLAAADLCMVTLNPASANYSMPSKIFSFMSSERPILAITPASSEVADLLRIWSCGINVPPGQPALLSEEIMRLSKQPSYLEILGKNGRQALINHYSRTRCVSLFEQTLEQVAG